MNFKKLIQQTLLSIITIITPAAYADDPHWTYDEQAEWGALENTDVSAPIPELYPFAECGLGQKQSPVDISAPSVNLDINRINLVYSAVPLSISNNGHTIKVNMPIVANPNASFVGREKYQLLQFHFHAPSEHTISGVSYPLEVHFVHSAPSGRLAVVGVFFKVGKENLEFQKILDNAPLVVGEFKSDSEVIDPYNLLPSSRLFYTYAGSLTTPPCTEGVDWYVLRRPITVSKAQIAQFEALYSGNARAVEQLNGRVVETLR
ncbi:carbonic anhydrase [Methylovulum miyakonense]|uniref:carbonic anhydrase n=1 Tax=Methylovulum miyakonense TaxID=645578 RepID=UPI00037614DF|nr:carbonic anhydrase family protein [Methylovulum miyakonense]